MNADALVLTKPRTLERRHLPVPRIDDESGLLRIEACGLCGTDHEQFSGHLPTGFAFIPGHEIIGVIEGIGDAARARWGVSVGQRVAVEVAELDPPDLVSHGTPPASHRGCARRARGPLASSERRPTV